MAEIYLASAFGPEGFEKQVVIKRIRPLFASDPLFVEMFVAEARLASKLNHANIVQIFDFDRHDDTFYLAMEYVRGHTLADAAQRARELSVSIHPLLAAQIGAEVARALGFAHRLAEGSEPLHIVHRDVTPHNVLVAYEGAVKLTDFGIAKSGARASTVGALKGKFAYMSPEQSRGEPVDARTDVFALGITLWELLTSSRLFGAESDVAVLRAVQQREVVPPQQLNPLVDDVLGGIVTRALERAPEARYQSALELERALSRYIVGTARAPEETDVGLWMRELFPLEATRAEPTVPSPGRSGGQASTSRLPTNPSLPAAVEAPPADAAPPTYDPTVALPGAVPASPPVSHLTPVVPDEGTTRDLPGGRAWRTVAGISALALVLLAGFFALRPFLGPGLPRRAEPTSAEVKPSTAPVVPPTRPTELAAATASGTETSVRPTPRPAEPAAATTSGTETSVAPTPSPPTVAPARATISAPATPATPKSASPSRRGVAAPPTSVQRPSPRQVTAAPGPPGKLVLTVSPWGEVFIDGRSLGEQVGRKEHDLPAGEHTLEVQGPSSWGPKAITIQPGQRTAQAVLLH